MRLDAKPDVQDENENRDGSLTPSQQHPALRPRPRPIPRVRVRLVRRRMYLKFPN